MYVQYTWQAVVRPKHVIFVNTRILKQNLQCKPDKDLPPVDDVSRVGKVIGYPLFGVYGDSKHLWRSLGVSVCVAESSSAVHTGELHHPDWVGPHVPGCKM